MSAFSDLAGLQPRPYKSPNMSPTSRFHSEGLPHSITAIDAQNSEAISKFLEASSVTLVLDVRPFNLYSQSHLKSAVNICVPTTLLKRPRYDLQHMISASNLPTDLKEAVLDSSKNMKVLLYDSASVDSQLSFQLHQTMLKFLPHERFDLSYVRGGLDKIDPSLTESSSLMLPLDSPISGVSPGTPFLTGFSLPSATSSDNKLLMSIKKSNLKLDTVTTYNYNFQFPENFEQKKSRLPGWLSFFADVYGKKDSMRLIVERFNGMFNRLEKAEQVRLRMAISNMDKNSELCRLWDQNLHDSAGYGTPLTLCPCCDKIEYTIPQGVEYGYKNRYNNIWPYEHSRVHLISSPSCTHKKDSSDDYFNANYISYKKISDRGYIATQNPLDATKDDFWSTVWYKGVKAIVCLAGSPVFGQQAYYELDQFLEKSQLDIRIKSSEQYSSFTLREIVLTKNGKSQTVHHFAYQKWPDFGTPEELSTVFELMRTKDEKLALHYDSGSFLDETTETWDVLVHCSAGCGRTGCYITMDMVVDSFKNPNHNEIHYDPWGNDDLVYKSIQFQRQQRISMVQNLDQFIFCYESILNYIVNNLIE
ncbi:hypothetical protein METBIDRAFT_37339 [Metschnikowia bicuspidata var. bicuspidata NRRL YB-4993]|uniref:protein-tyrosine-phosphatase n=1 Tax=Metschnikowia bicuspidata var. bicuspidata NRRL YB-4993 TaxID=869754 RepID=A0A1A0HGR2_9ASCO|nr:hypothetical protein METBIDRAFT_37339 [Metschnikowia bicuspidata var. bicuspidata NRRL YB-4993]OBA23364.1 hypothetical protein METBIDRAFT_37339 [Metschnikowia bicuspidata var. bicuspidata NRRL YB-4993]